MRRLRTFCGSVLFQFILFCFLLTCVLPPGAWALPQIEITSPSDNGTVWGDTMVDVSYRGERGAPVIKILLYLDGSLVKEWKLPTPQIQGRQSFAWKFTLASGETHVIGAKAIDSLGGESGATIQVRVQKMEVGGGNKRVDKIPPVIRIYYPAQGAKVNGIIKVKAEGEDDTGITAVIFYVDGKLHKMIMNAPPYLDELDTTRLTDGYHVLQAAAYDAQDNEGKSAEVTIIVDNKAGGLTTAQEGVGASGAPPVGPISRAPGPATVPEVVIPPPSPAPAAPLPPGISGDSPRAPDAVGTEMAALPVEPLSLTTETRITEPGRVLAAPVGAKPATPASAGPRSPGLEPVRPPSARSGSGGGPALAPVQGRVVIAPPRMTPPPPEVPRVPPRPGQALTDLSLDGYTLALLPGVTPTETSPRMARPSTRLAPPVVPSAPAAAPPPATRTGQPTPGAATPAAASGLPAPPRVATPATLAATTPPRPAPSVPAGQAAAAGVPTVMELVRQPLTLAGIAQPAPARTATPPGEMSLAATPAPAPTAPAAAVPPGQAAAAPAAAVVGLAVESAAPAGMRRPAPARTTTPPGETTVAMSAPAPPAAATPVPPGQAAAAPNEGWAEPDWDAAWGTPILSVSPSRNAQPPDELRLARAVSPVPATVAPQAGAAPPATGVGTWPAAAPASAARPAGPRTSAPQGSPAPRVAMTPTMQPAPVAPEGKREPVRTDSLPTAVAHIRGIKVIFDGEPLDLRALPALHQGVSVAPLREIFERTNGTLYWYPQDKRVEGSNGQLDLRLQIGNPQAQVNGEPRSLALAPFVKQGRTMVPLQFLADALNVNITFNPASGQLVISSNDF